MGFNCEFMENYNFKKINIKDTIAYIFTYTLLDEIDDELLLWMFKLMPKERQKKANSYKKDLDRKLCIISFALLVLAMEKLFNISRDYDWNYNKNGKPFLKSHPEIFFNISHCKVGVACVIANQEVGIDIQDMIDFDEKLAELICSKNELEIINNSDKKGIELTKIWTKKESYLKMLGIGLIDSLQDIDVYKLDNFYQKIDWQNNYVLSVSI